MLKDIHFQDFLTSRDFIVLVAAIVVSWLAFGVLRTVRAAALPAIAIAAIVLVLQYVGVTPEQLWHEITQLPQILGQAIAEVVNTLGN